MGKKIKERKTYEELMQELNELRKNLSLAPEHQERLKFLNAYDEAVMKEIKKEGLW